MSKMNSFMCGTFVGVILLAVIIGITNSDNHSIQPIEVYQGKTTL